MSALDLETEVHDLCARRDIHDALCRYMRGQDRLMRELHLSAFHEDAYVDCGPFAGSAAGFVDFAQGLLGGFKGSQHVIGQVQIQVDGNKAHGEVYFVAWHRIVEDGVDKDLFVAGRYVDEYQDRGTGWKIARRRELIDWARTDPASDSFLHGPMRLVFGARGDADFSNRRDWPE